MLLMGKYMSNKTTKVYKNDKNQLQNSNYFCGERKGGKKGKMGWGFTVKFYIVKRKLK